MGDAKAIINLQEGFIELQGSDSFVSKYLDKYGALILDPTVPKKESIFKPDADDKFTDQNKKAKIKKGGPSCADRISLLIDKNFFKTQKVAQEISDKLSEAGTPYQANLITATLINLVKAGKLRRIKHEKKWNYLNP